MGLSIVTNTSANAAQQSVSRLNKENLQSIAKLSSGTRAVSLRDDASLVVIGSRADANIFQLKQVLSNTSQATSTLQTVDSSYQDISKILEKQVILANRATSGKVTDAKRSLLDYEFKDLNSQINNVISKTSFNGKQIFEKQGNINELKSRSGVQVVSSSLETVIDTKYNRKTEKFIARIDGKTYGTYDVTKRKGEGVYNFSIKDVNYEVDESSFQYNKGFGFNRFVVVSSQEDKLNLDFNISLNNKNKGFKVEDLAPTSTFLGLDDLSLRSKEKSIEALDQVRQALDKLDVSKSKVGAGLSRLDFAYSSNKVALENSKAAKDSLLNVDVASETVKLAVNQYILKSGVFLMAQVNKQTGDLLELIR